jgi:hypothetical protein
MQTTIPIAAVIAAAMLFSGCGTATNDRAGSSPTQPAAAETPSPDLSTSAFPGVISLETPVYNPIPRGGNHPDQPVWTLPAGTPVTVVCQAKSPEPHPLDPTSYASYLWIGYKGKEDQDHGWLRLPLQRHT